MRYYFGTDANSDVFVDCSQVIAYKAYMNYIEIFMARKDGTPFRESPSLSYGEDVKWEFYKEGK